MCETVCSEMVPAASNHKVERKMSTRATWNSHEANSDTWLACVLFYLCDSDSNHYNYTVQNTFLFHGNGHGSLFSNHIEEFTGLAVSQRNSITP